MARIGEYLVGGRRSVSARCLAKHRRQKSEVLSLGRATPNVFHLAQSSILRLAQASLPQRAHRSRSWEMPPHDAGIRRSGSRPRCQCRTRVLDQREAHFGSLIGREVRSRAAEGLVLQLQPAARRRSWTRSGCSAMVRPSLTPPSMSAWRTHRRTDSTDTSKSAATSATVRSPRRATATTYRLNSAGALLGTATSFPPGSPGRKRCQPNPRQTPWSL